MLQTRLINEKANCFALRKRITRLKCVNSVVKSVHILPEKGCLHGTMSESPWKSHQTGMDLLSDPLGTESPHVQI